MPLTTSRLMQVLQCPGMQRIYVHDYSAVDIPTLKRLEGAKAHCYSERAVIMAQPNDVVVTHDVDLDHVRYLDQIGIGPGTEGIVDLNRVDCDDSTRPLAVRLATSDGALAAVADRVARSPMTLMLSPYFASPPLDDVQSRLARRIGRPVAVEANVDATQIANRKDVVRDAAKSLGVPIPNGEICRLEESDNGSADELVKAISRNMQVTGSVMVRGTWSMHGVDNLVVYDPFAEETVRRWMSLRGHIRTYLVESRLPLVASPNVQMYVCDDGSVVHLATTNQRLDESSAYVGSQYPHATIDDDELVAHSFTLGRWLSSVGYRGFLGIDFIETIDRRTGSPAYLLAEVNGRINGATYGLALAERINQVRTTSRKAPFPAWVTNTDLKVCARSFGELADAIGDWMYSESRDIGGVIPYTVGLLRHGKVHAAIVAATLDEAKRIEREVAARLGAG